MRLHCRIDRLTQLSVQFPAFAFLFKSLTIPTTMLARRQRQEIKHETELNTTCFIELSTAEASWVGISGEAV